MRLDSVPKKIWIFVLILIINFPLFAQWGTYLKITRVNDNYTYESYKAVTYVSVHNYDLIAFDIEAFFKVEENFDSDIWLKDVSEASSDIFENWQDQTGTFYQGEERKSFKRTLYVRPHTQTETPYRATFKVQSGWGKKDSPVGPGRISEFTINIIVLPEDKFVVALGDTLPLSKPLVLDEPPFTSGTSNLVSWNPAEWKHPNAGVDLVAQDLYFFDTDDMSELIPSVQGLFKADLSTTRETWFQGLEDGHTYGYIAKSIYITSNDTITQYSNVVFSTQDNSPPSPVVRPRISTESGKVELIWAGVDDAISTVRSYEIFRAEDTQIATLIDTVVADPLQETYTWVDNRTSSDVEYNYRVRAVDIVGNVGDGERSNSVIFKGDGTEWTVIPPTLTTDDYIENSQFIKGPIDVLQFLIEGQEDLIRFEVARDDTSYFHQSTGAGHRYFDSGWLALSDTVNNEQFYHSSQNVDWINYEFDYSSGIDLNFVNGHTYYRKITRKIAEATYVAYLSPVVPDCFPPDDIRNFYGETILDESSTLLKWKVNLTWEPAADHISGVKQYHLFRKLEGLDSLYQSIAIIEDAPGLKYFMDTIDVLPDSLKNPTLSYRVIAEDQMGNRRSIDSVNWQVDEIALAAPDISFANLSETNDLQKGTDTLFTKNDRVILKINHFDLNKSTHYTVLLNGKEEIHRNRNQDTLHVALPQDEISSIQVRAIYTGNRFSLYSEPKVVARTQTNAPLHFTAHNDTNFWGGHLYLSWERPSIDVSEYEIWRSADEQAAQLVGVSRDTTNNVQWTDYYDQNEITQKSTTPLVNYQTYSYQIRKRNVFGDLTEFTNAQLAYANKPPQIIKHDTPKISENGEKALTIHWERVYPTLADQGQKTYVYVYQDTFELENLTTGLIETAIIANSDSSYTYHKAVPGHNYIFRIKEIPNELDSKMSAWSEPYTITLQILDPLYLVPQPHGGMYVRWENPDIMKKYDVQTIKVFITGSSGSDSLLFPVSEIDYMTPPGILTHGETYQYSVFALDSLEQVVADNAAIDTCDTGAVFIPEITPFYHRYYSGDSIDVSWNWKNVQGVAIQNSTRGAKTATLQLSVSRTFPNDDEQTVTVGPFAVDSSVTQKRVPIPELGNRENSSLFFRITAKDTWNHPSQNLWSTDFYDLKTAVYDPVPPRSVSDFSISSVRADSLSSDSILVAFTWTGKGVEWPVNGDAEQWDRMIANVDSYKLIRLDANGKTILAGIQTVQLDTLPYVFYDRTSNQPHQWKIVSVDSAGHQTASEEIQAPVFLVTPDPPVATEFRQCQASPYVVNDATLEYAYEIAVDADHFALAYQIYDINTLDRLLCRSGWTSDLEFQGCQPWAAVIHDTTYFRSKVRVKADGIYWESGWSHIATYPTTEGIDRQTSSTVSMIRTFEIMPNYPNPFNGTTIIAYQIPENALVYAKLYNIKGEMINTLINKEQQPGRYEIVWDGRNESGNPVASGIYFFHVLMDNHHGLVKQKRMKITFIK